MWRSAKQTLRAHLCGRHVMPRLKALAHLATAGLVTSSTLYGHDAPVLAMLPIWYPGTRKLEGEVAAAKMRALQVCTFDWNRRAKGVRACVLTISALDICGCMRAPKLS